MKRNHTISAVLCVLLFFVFSGCSLHNTPPVQDEWQQFTPYKQVTLADLQPFNSPEMDDPDLTDWPEDSLNWELDNLGYDLYLFRNILEQISKGKVPSISPVPRSISAGLQLELKDEVFRTEFDDDDTYSEVTLDHLQVKLAGKINSLSDLLAFFRSEEDTVPSAISADGRILVSSWMRAITDQEILDTEAEDFVVVGSLYLDLGISQSDPFSDEPSGLLSGKVQFSVGNNVMQAWDEDSTLYCPVVLQFDAAPFKNVDLALLTQAMAEESQKEEEEIDFWPIVKQQMWNDASGDLLKITRIIGTPDASSSRLVTTWTNKEAYELISDILSRK